MEGTEVGRVILVGSVLSNGEKQMTEVGKLILVAPKVTIKGFSVL